MDAVMQKHDVRRDGRLRFPTLPPGGLAGTSFKHEHFKAILKEGPQQGFFEVHAEDHVCAGGPPHRSLERIRSEHAVSLHGVCMSIGGPQPLWRLVLLKTLPHWLTARPVL